MIVLMWC